MRLLADEGGYCADPADPGGATNFGISSRQYPNLDVRALTRERAIEIYWRDFWMRLGLEPLPPEVGAKTFNLAVNIGPAHAIVCLQRALRACGGAILEDHAIGPATVTAALAANSDALLAAMRSEAAGYYRTLAALDRGRHRYLEGWLKRAYE